MNKIHLRSWVNKTRMTVFINTLDNTDQCDVGSFQSAEYGWCLREGRGRNDQSLKDLWNRQHSVMAVTHEMAHQCEHFAHSRQCYTSTLVLCNSQAERLHWLKIQTELLPLQYFNLKVPNYAFTCGKEKTLLHNTNFQSQNSKNINADSTHDLANSLVIRSGNLVFCMPLAEVVK